MSPTRSASSFIVHDTPVPARESEDVWGSDVVAAVLRELEIPYISLVPGSSYRGLHDSLVNYLGNRAPQMVLNIHEESAIAVAHGYAKVTGRMIAAAVHANVGLLRSPMAIYNAWCDRAPILIIGATGPWDATRRRPWIDWIHTSSDQGGLIRNFTKWDNQPGSPAAAMESIMLSRCFANPVQARVRRIAFASGVAREHERAKTDRVRRHDTGADIARA